MGVPPSSPPAGPPLPPGRPGAPQHRQPSARAFQVTLGLAVSGLGVPPPPVPFPRSGHAGGSPGRLFQARGWKAAFCHRALEFPGRTPRAAGLRPGAQSGWQGEPEPGVPPQSRVPQGGPRRNRTIPTRRLQETGRWGPARDPEAPGQGAPLLCLLSHGPPPNGEGTPSRAARSLSVTCSSLRVWCPPGGRGRTPTPGCLAQCPSSGPHPISVWLSSPPLPVSLSLWPSLSISLSPCLSPSPSRVPPGSLGLRLPPLPHQSYNLDPS